MNQTHRLLRPHRFVPLLALALGSLLTACDSPDDGESFDDDRTDVVVFEGAAVNDTLRDAPDTVHRVDLTDGTAYYFDGRDEAFDISSFSFLCPSMDFPIPLADAMAPHAGPEVTGYWSVQLTDAKPVAFRLSQHCVRKCQPDGSDCFDLCPDPPPPPIQF